MTADPTDRKTITEVLMSGFESGAADLNIVSQELDIAGGTLYTWAKGFSSIPTPLLPKMYSALRQALSDAEVAELEDADPDIAAQRAREEQELDEDSDLGSAEAVAEPTEALPSWSRPIEVAGETYPLVLMYDKDNVSFSGYVGGVPGIKAEGLSQNEVVIALKQSLLAYAAGEFVPEEPSVVVEEPVAVEADPSEIEDDISRLMKKLQSKVEESQ